MELDVQNSLAKEAAQLRAAGSSRMDVSTHVCKRLTELGESVTPHAVLAITGFGSMRDVKKDVDLFKQGQSAVLEKAQSFFAGVPESLQGLIIGTLTTVFNEMQAVTRESAEAEIKRHRESINKELEGVRQEAAQLAAIANQELLATQQDLQETKQALTVATTDREVALTGLASANTQIRMLEEQAERNAQQVVTLQNELQQLRETHAQQIQDIADKNTQNIAEQREQYERRLEMQIGAFERAEEILNGQIVYATKQIDDARKEARELKVSLEAVKKSNESRVTELLVSIKQEKARSNHLGQELAETKGRLSAIEEELARANSKLASSTPGNLDMAAERRRLRKVAIDSFPALFEFIENHDAEIEPINGQFRIVSQEGLVMLGPYDDLSSLTESLQEGQ